MTTGSVSFAAIIGTACLLLGCQAQDSRALLAKGAIGRKAPLEMGPGHELDSILATEIATAAFPKVTLDVAFTILEKLQPVNIRPNWDAMEAVGVTRRTEVAFAVHNATFERILNELLARASQGSRSLDYAVSDAAIVVSSVADLANMRYVVVYDVRDLLRDAMAAYQDLDSTNRMPTVPSNSSDEARLRYVRPLIPGNSWLVAIDQLALVLLASELQEGWELGEVVREYDGLFVVRNTYRGHRRISRMLAEMRLLLAKGSDRGR